jgi:hypothetical protein
MPIVGSRFVAPIERPLRRTKALHYSRRSYKALLVLASLALLAVLLTSWRQPEGVAAGAGAHAPTPPIYSVLFDNSNAETAGNADWIISTSQPDPLVENPNPLVETDWTGGISSWGVALQRTGRYTLKTNTSTITYGNGGNPMDLSHFDALVLPEPNTLYTAAEKTAILNFVFNGGGLFMIADHTGSDRNNDGFDSLEIFNDLMNNGGAGTDVFGIQFDVLNIQSENPSNRSNPTDPVLQGPFGTAAGTILRSGTTETINAGHNSNVRGVIYRNSFPNTGSTGVAVARSVYGSGRVVAMGDSSAIDDGTCQPGNDCFDGWNDPAGDNNVLFPNGTEWIVNGGPAGSPTATPSPTRTPTITFTATRTATGQATATATATPVAGTAHVVISEFRTRGPGGAADEFIELYNPTNAAVDIGGWKINGSNNAGSIGTRVTIGAGTSIPAHGHFLAVNNSMGGYSGAVPGDQTYATGITDDGGVALLDVAGATIDQAGMSAGSAYGEGTRLTALTTNVDRGYERKPGGLQGSGQDTDDNTTDFQITTPSAPQNLASQPVPPLTTPTMTGTPTATASPSRTASHTASATHTPTPTGTSTSTSTETPTQTPSSTFTVTATNTPIATSTSAATDTPTPTPTTASILVGHVTWQGRPAQPNAAQQVPITLTLKTGTTEVNYPVQNTDASGFFTSSVAGLPSGIYQWRAKNPKYLANSGSVNLDPSGVTSVEMGPMRAGDCNNDNVVNVSDFNILKNTFGKTQGDTGYDDRADFTGEHAVSVSDFNLQKNTFGSSGGPPLTGRNQKSEIRSQLLPL